MILPYLIVDLKLCNRTHWTIEIPLVEDGPTMLFEDLVKIAGYELHYQENMETYENEYWLTKLEN
ncbi:TPA: hypothetical protein RD599_002406 [Enterococcus faecium]|nr:hypothetical protein [Enterococcus faecium]